MVDAPTVGYGPDVANLSELTSIAEDDPHWSPDELASFASNPGSGRVLHVRPGAQDRTPVEQCLRDAGYCLGRLPVTRDPSHLPQAAATFGPDVIYVALARPESMCLAALEALAVDPKTQKTPLVALVPSWASSRLIDEAYARSGCDFFRTDATEVELLARTHLLVRLAMRHRDSEMPLHERPIPQAANAPMAERLDLQDLATGVYSATYLRHRLPTETARAHRYQRDLSVLAVRCPAAAHDETEAASAARRLREVCRDVDILGRLERDVFVLILPETPTDGVARLAQRLGETMTADGRTACFGHSTLGSSDGDESPYTAQTLLATACAAIPDPPALAGYSGTG